MSKGKYLIFIAVLFLASCIVSFNDYELQPKNYVINKDFNEIMFDETFAKKPFPQQPKPKHRFSAVFAPNCS